ncbi:MAG: hypothetical protein Ct9H90mP24_6950 [Methanobacteriota archaeon]|nr:MAG: hypothetical protein Ct9H90mP24_6950 [Euryarchaeota archaeon]
MSTENGVIYRISGPVVTATGIAPRMYEVVRVGNEGLMGEVIELHGEQSVTQRSTKRHQGLNRESLLSGLDRLCRYN